MSDIKIQQFDEASGPPEDFLALPAKVETLDEAHARAERSATVALLSKDNYYFSHSAARGFVAHRGGDPVGRVVAFNNRLLRTGHQHCGLVGLFSAIDDAQVARRLIEAAASWLGEQGATVLRGPMDGDIWHRWRFMTHGFDTVPFPGEPRQPAYYPDLFLAAGFAPVRTFSTKLVTDLEAQLAKLQRAATFNAKRGVTFRTFDRSHTDRDLPILFELCRHSFVTHWGVTDTSEAEFSAIYKRWLSRVGAEQIIFGVDPAGRDVGLGFAVEGPADTVNMRTVAVLPGHCGFGLGQALVAESYRRAIAAGKKQVHHCMMGPASPTQRWDHGLGVVTRQYTMYERGV